MKSLKLLLLPLLILSLAHFVTFNHSALAHQGDHKIGGNDSEEENDDNVQDLEQRIKELESKVNETHQKGQTLQREIDTFNSQIELTQLRIQQSLAQITKKEKEIVELATDIEDLGSRIEKLVELIGYQEDVLNERMRARYKSMESSPVVVVFGSDTINKVIQKTEYLKVMANQDKKLLTQMNSTKKAYGLQKNLIEDKKKEEEVLKAQLEAEKANLEVYNNDLANKKSEKDALLKKTQNDEAKFQEQLEEARKELDQILRAASVLQNQEPRDVDKGELIGIQGNTGFSSGEHLHFGVYRYSSFEDITGWDWYYSNTVNPAKKLKKKDVLWNTGCESYGYKSTGDGDWQWPVNNPTISQGYGHTCWSDIYYGGKDHPAYDMYGSTGAPVYAVEKGRAYFCKNCLGDGGNGVFIFHPDDYMTVYWHLR